MKVKKGLAVLLAASTTLGMLAGCGTTDEQTSTPDASESAGGDQDTIVIGTIQDLSGSASEAGNANAWGVEYAVRQINEQGGINGKKLELVTMDCKGDVQEGINCYRLLVDEHNVAAIVGPPLSNPALAWVDLSEEDQLPIVGHYMDER